MSASFTSSPRTANRGQAIAPRIRNVNRCGGDEAREEPLLRSRSLPPLPDRSRKSRSADEASGSPGGLARAHSQEPLQESHRWKEVGSRGLVGQHRIER